MGIGVGLSRAAADAMDGGLSRRVGKTVGRQGLID